MNAPARTFEARPADNSGPRSMRIAIVGPPGGGKTVSSLRIGQGIQAVRGGKPILIETEPGRAENYADQFDFLIVPFAPPFRSEDFLAAIQQQMVRNPACIIVDSLSDEHDGIGGYLDYRNEETARMGGNSWAGTAKPAAGRKNLIRGLRQIKVPLIFTFRAREKTRQDGKGRGAEIVNLGWMPVAPLEIVHDVDLACILPPRADGVPVWSSERLGEAFISKLPNFLAHCIQQGKPLDEATGRALAQWAAGTSSATPPVEKPAPSPDISLQANGAGDDDMRAAFIAGVRRHIDAATDAQALADWWKSDEQKRARRDCELSEQQVAELVAYVTARHKALSPPPA